MSLRRGASDLYRTLLAESDDELEIRIYRTRGRGRFWWEITAAVPLGAHTTEYEREPLGVSDRFFCSPVDCTTDAQINAEDIQGYLV